MTGISDVFKSAQNAIRHVNIWLLFTLDLLPECVAKWLRVLFPNSLVVIQRVTCPQPILPDPRPTLRLPKLSKVIYSEPSAISPTCNRRERPGVEAYPHWSLLLPMTSRGVDGHTFWGRLETTIHKLGLSIDDADGPRYTEVRVGIDFRDKLLDNEKSRQRIIGMLSVKAPLANIVFEETFPPAFEGKLCWIWGRMARGAVDSGADYILLIGDDVELLTPGWQREVEIEFTKIAERTGLPLGAACVALRDTSFPAFPTFPVIHRFHLETFGELFPDEFINQHGDPFLFELYRRFGASNFAPVATVRNTVGGSDTSRYLKEDSESVWHGAVLSRCVQTLQACLEPYAVRIPCIDVVVPSFRCDTEVLRRLTSIRFSDGSVASLSILVVVDRPDAPNLSELRQLLTSYGANNVVRVVTMPCNQGASMARNNGLAQSFGEHVIFLDDDVEPCEGLLDGYLSAILRSPDAAGYIGTTTLPKAQTLTEHAILACRIAFFYDIALKMARPPWGVTANLCVAKWATNNSIWFDKRFPKTGGGEDVDFCFRLKQRGILVSVPAAKVLHPFWARPFAQVAGWASGDVHCLSSQPGSAFRTPPNWVEIIACLLITGHYKEALIVGAMEHILLFLSYVPETTRALPWYKRAVIGVLATIPPMLQDYVRLYSKLTRGQIHQLCLSFDWMDGCGHGDHMPSTVLALLIKGMCYLLTITILLHRHSSGANVVLKAIWVTIMIAWSVGQRQVILSVPLAPLKPLQLKTRATPFVVLGCQRTGTNHLCGLLHHISSIAMHNELFNLKGVYTHCGGICTDVSARDASPGDLLDAAFSVRGEGHAVGFKLFPEHIRRSEAHHDLFMRLLRDPAVKKIILQRRSRLAVAVSSVRAQITGSYTKTDAEKTDQGNMRVHLKPSDLQRFCESYDKYYKFIAEMTPGQQVMHIYHEDVVDDEEATVGHVCSFLGIARGESRLKSVFCKQSERLVPDARDVVNYKELQRIFNL